VTSYALVAPDGIVCEVVASESGRFPVAPPFKWILCPAEVVGLAGWTYDGSTFSPPAPEPPPPPDRLAALVDELEAAGSLSVLAAERVRKG